MAPPPDRGLRTSRPFRITTWPEGFVVEAQDEDHAIVEAIGRIEVDGYLLAAVELDEAESADAIRRQS